MLSPHPSDSFIVKCIYSFAYQASTINKIVFKKLPKINKSKYTQLTCNSVNGYLKKSLIYSASITM